jgi:hypothetical protein
MTLSLANNQLTDLVFMDRCLPVNTLEDLDVSGNQITDLIQLRYLPVYTKLHTVKVGFIEMFSGLPIVQFVNYLSPTITTFDDEPCGNVQTQFDTEQLVKLLVDGSEQRLRKFLVDSDLVQIAWDEPQFIDFREESPPSPLDAMMDRIRQIEDRIARGPQRPAPQTGTLLSPFPKQEELPELRGLRQDIAEMKQQIAQVAQLLYVHDQALRELWNGSPA